jgi:hypothetical protein
LIQVIILTALIMMIGTVSSAKKVKEEKQNDETLSIATEL